jgi:hypothetical protein
MPRCSTTASWVVRSRSLIRLSALIAATLAHAEGDQLQIAIRRIDEPLMFTDI